MCVTHNTYFRLIANLFGIVVTGAQNEYSYSFININRDKGMRIRVFVNLLAEDMLKNSQPIFSPADVSRNLPSLWPLPGGGKYACLLATDMMPGGGRSQTLDYLWVSEVQMVEMNRERKCVSSMSDDELNTLTRYKDVLGEDEAKRAYWNWCRVCYRHRKCILQCIPARTHPLGKL